MKNEIYTVCIEAYNSEAMGVCHIGGRAVFVPRTLVGERWEIKLVKVSASAVYGRAMRLLEASPARTGPDCSGFGKCGGCDCRHMRYEEELRFKLEKVNNALTRIGFGTAVLLFFCAYKREDKLFSLFFINGIQHFLFVVF